MNRYRCTVGGETCTVLAESEEHARDRVGWKLLADGDEWRKIEVKLIETDVYKEHSNANRNTQQADLHPDRSHR